jgi:NAD(P)-dependent dehydrogenase (short-subunit alcohol dehydrogenase family)
MSVPFPAERTAIVTGSVSPRGIGRATALRLAARGWSIGVIDLDDDAARAFAAEITAEHSVPAHGVGANLADEASAHAAVATLARELPQIVALANIAGVSSPDPYLELDSAEWRRVLDVNLDGVHYVSQPVARILAANRVGRIVNISSISAQRGGGTFGKTPYSVSKAAIIGLTRSLARELGPYDVTANAISPGPIDTDIMGGTLDDARKAELTRDQVISRIGTVHDVAAAIEFLLSEDAGFITGQTLSVNGGFYML